MLSAGCVASTSTAITLCCSERLRHRVVFLLILVASCIPMLAAGSRPRVSGLLVDAARVPEAVEYYRRLIDFCQAWGLNALVFRVADDEGLAVRFASHPELITHHNALSAAEVRDLARYAQQRGIELIPEVESFGHCGYITRVPQYADLLDRAPNGGPGTGLIPVDPRSLRIVSDLYREAASMFPSRYLHGGFDEVTWGGSGQSRSALKTRTRPEIWADYVNKLNVVARELGKELIVWADHVLRREPEILRGLSKELILLDWDYAAYDPDAIEEAARRALSAGFRVIGGPALTWCRWGPRIGSQQLRNVDAYVEAYGRIDNARCLGVIVTNWLPSRYLQGSIWDSLAYAAVAVREGGAAARERAFRRFVERHYGASWDAVWADIFRTSYDIVPSRVDCSPAWMRPALPVPWSSAKELEEMLKRRSGSAPPFTRLLSQITLVEPSVRRNLGDFQSFRLSIEYLEQLHWRNTAVVEAAQPGLTMDSATDLIRIVAVRDRRLLDRLDADWNRGRPSDSPIKFEALITQRRFPENQLLFRFRLAAHYSEELARQPKQFFSMLSSTASR